MADHLYSLIRSLSPGEKRYFKLYAARQADAKKTNYEKLFDLYNESPEEEPFDEEEFLKKLKRRKLGKYLSDDKNYLSQLILKAMRSYASEKKADAELADLIQEMNFLLLKGLTEHSERLFDKAWEIAEQRQLTEQKVKLLSIRRSIDRSQYNAARLEYEAGLRRQELTALAQLSDEREAAFIYEDVHRIYLLKEMDLRAAEIDHHSARLQALYDSPHLTFDCMNTIIMTRCVILDHRTGYREALDLIKHLIAEWDKSPWRIREQTRRYVKLFDIQIVFCSRLLLTEEMAPLIEKLQAVEASEKDVAKDIFYQLSHIRVMHYYLQDRFRESLVIIPDIHKGLKEFGALLNFWQKRILHSCICVIYLKNKMYSQLLDAVQEVYALSGRGKDKQPRIEDMRIYEFIAQYELGNTELLHYAVRNNQRFFKEREPNNVFLEELWKLLRQFLQEGDRPKAAARKLKAAIEALVPDPESNSALKRELILWLEEKC